jgi:hypothetical protein
MFKATLQPLLQEPYSSFSAARFAAPGGAFGGVPWLGTLVADSFSPLREWLSQ